jgi:tetratricopeptide (TPR) repeat protein
MLTICGCGSSDEPPSARESVPMPPRGPDGRVLHPVTLPDLSKMNASVQAQVRGQHAALTRKLDDRGTSTADLADAYGQLGKLLMAAQYYGGAEPYFRNAQTLVPNEFRWPYYLGHLHRRSGDIAKATQAFERARQLQPDDVATLVWLGDLQLAQDRPAEAEPLFTRALSLQPTSLSARFGLGRAALAKQDFSRAVALLEDVLARNPEAAAAHYPIAMAYRGLGETDKAEAHLRQREDHEIVPADPLMVELDELLESPEAFESRGIRALDDEDWPGAAAQFRRGLALEPDSASLHHRLGTAIAMMEDHAAAQQEFEAAVRLDPDYHPAQYSLGVLLQSKGRHREAIERFSAALQARPGYTEARLRLAVSLRRAGRPKESLKSYQEILSLDPDLHEARLGEAMALIQLRRYREARDRMMAAMKAYPDQSVYAHGLARLLAASPDEQIRDGNRAMVLVQELIQKEQRTVDLGETFAMALAAQGRYDEAAGVQRDLIAGVQKAGLKDLATRLSENLALYQRGEPCRTPWTEDRMP